MSFTLRFKEQAWQEWLDLEPSIREQFAKKLHTLKENPRIESARQSGYNQNSI
jgi:mRNA interferase RelE/StbE